MSCVEKFFIIFTILIILYSVSTTRICTGLRAFVNIIIIIIIISSPGIFSSTNFITFSFGQEKNAHYECY